MNEEKIVITKEQAISVLNISEDNMVHTFYNMPFGLMGSDHDLESIKKDMDNCLHIEITGPGAKAMKHGIALVPQSKLQEDVLFVETDMDALLKLEKELMTK